MKYIIVDDRKIECVDCRHRPHTRILNQSENKHQNDCIWHIIVSLMHAILYIICLRRMFAYPENIARSQLMVSLSLQSTQNLEMQWLWLRKKCDRIEMIIATVNIANAHLLGHLSVVRCRIQRILLSRTLQMVYMGRCCSWTWHSVWAIRSGSEKTEKKTTIEENAEN